MCRLFLFFLAMAVCSCVLDRGEDRRSEILPGRYQAAQGYVEVEYDFQDDGSFTFARTESGRETITETGRWQYRYVDPEKRYLVESEVTRRDLGSDSAWTQRENLGYQYRIMASKPDEFRLDSGSQGEPGALAILYLFFGGTGFVVFHRQ